MESVKHTRRKIRPAVQAEPLVIPTASCRVEENVMQWQVEGVIGVDSGQKMLSISRRGWNGTPIKKDVAEAGGTILTRDVRNQNREF